MAFLRDDALDKLAATKDNDALSEAADSSCTSGYDNDGSTGYEIFENGFELGRDAGDRPVICVDADDVAYFFIGTLDEIRTKIAALPEASNDEDE